MVEEKTGEVEFNLAKWLNMEVARLISEANRAFVTGNFQKAVDCQISKRLTAGFTFTKEEREKLEAMEKKLGELVIQEKARNSFNPDLAKKGNLAYIELRKLYQEYVEYLNDLLDLYGWYGSRKKDASKIKW